MLPVQHSHIRRISDHPDSSHSDLQELNNSSHSDLQELNNLRDLLPSYQPISALDNYLIEPNEEAQTSQFSQDNLQYNEMMMKISQQTHTILKMQQELYYFKSQFFKIAKQNQNYLETAKQAQQLQTKLLALIKEQQKKLSECQNQLIEEQNLRKQEETLSQRRLKQIEEMRKELVYLKQSKAQSNIVLDKLNEQLRFQQKFIVQLSLKNQKIMKINLCLKEQLRITEKKLIQLQIELQDKCFGQLSQNLVRLKENHNLINKKSNDDKTSEPDQQKINLFKLKFNSQGQRETIKLPSRRDSVRKHEVCHREVKTLERERSHCSPHLIDKLKPLQEPKPQRKLYKPVDIQPIQRWKNNLSPPEFYL